MSIKLTPVLASLICGLSLACGSNEAPASEPAAAPAPTAPTTAPAPTAPTPAPTAAAAGPVVEDPTFTLAATAAGPYAANALGHFVVKLTPKGEYHVNEEYPIAIELKAPAGVTLPKASLAKADAAEFSASTARFDVPVTPTAAGEHRVTAKVSFAVCTPENCMPDERTLELALAVQ